MNFQIVARNQQTKQQYHAMCPCRPSGVPGLVIHNHIISDNDELIKRDYWTISHENSGYIIVDYIRTVKRAKEIALLMAELDWIVSREEIVKDKRYGELVRQMRKEK